MPAIKVQRMNGYSHRMRDYKIFIDGQPVGTVAKGGTKVFATTAGQHTVTAKMDSFSSPDILINVKENETKSLQVGASKMGKWLEPVTGGVVALHFMLKFTLDISYTIFLAIPLLLLLVYSLTAGRKKYLVTEELNGN